MIHISKAEANAGLLTIVLVLFQGRKKIPT